MNAAELVDVRERTTTLARVTTVEQSLVTMLGPGESPFLNGAALSPETGAMLGVPPALGRWFTPDEERSGARVIVLSDGVWRRFSGADRRIPGTTVTFTGNSQFVGSMALGTAYTIIGVMPRGFHFPDDGVDFWRPALLERPRDPRARVEMTAELKEGVSRTAA